MTKDTFVNLNLFYEKIDPILEKLDDMIDRTGRWLNSDTLKDEWVPASVRKYINYAREDNEKNREMVEELQEILRDFVRKGRRKPARIISRKPRIEHMNVISGGLYKPSEPKVSDGDSILTDKGAAWLREVRAKKGE